MGEKMKADIAICTHLISANEQPVLVLVGHLQLHRALEVGRPRRIAAADGRGRILDATASEAEAAV